MELGQCFKEGDLWFFQQLITLRSPIIHVVYPKSTFGTTSHRVAKLMQELEHYSAGWYVFALLFFPQWCKLPNYANRCTFGSIHCWLNMRGRESLYFWGCHIHYPSKMKAHFCLLIFCIAAHDKLLSRHHIHNNSSKSFPRLNRDKNHNLNLYQLIQFQKMNTLCI